jgi:hypothetical protein
VRDVVTDGRHKPGALESERAGLAGIEAEGVEYVAEIEAGGPHCDLDLAVGRGESSHRLEIEILD